MGFRLRAVRVEGSKVLGLGFRVEGSNVLGLGFRVEGSTVWGCGVSFRWTCGFSDVCPFTA